MKRILVTGAGGPAGINVIRALKQEGYYVVSTDINKYSEGFLFADRSYLTLPAKDPRFVAQLDYLIEKEKVDLVILTVDEEIIALANRRSMFESKIVLHPKKSVKLCMDKYNLYGYLLEKIPEVIPEYSLDPEDIRSEKIVRKPRIGRGGRGIIVGNKDQFAKEDGIFYVEYLPGREWTVDVLTDRDSNLVIAVPRVRIKTRGSISIIGEVRLDKRILTFVREILSTIKFTGPLNIQFKEDAHGNPKLQEINPRFSGGLDITIAAGINLPKLVVKIFGENYDLKDLNLTFKIREGVYYKIWKVFY